MTKSELVQDISTLDELASLLSKEISASSEKIVSRYIHIVRDNASFNNGHRSYGHYAQANLNKENITKGVYTQTPIENLLAHDFKEVTVARDLQEHRFNFHPKGIALPTVEETFVGDIPSEIDCFDDEFKEFTKSHKGTSLSRYLDVEQRIIVNSDGGTAIQTIPFFTVLYTCGYEPIPTTRCLTVVCNSNEDIKRMPSLIKYLPDPTPNHRIKRQKTFSDAFDELFKISGLKFGNLNDAGIPTSELYDVVMLSGIPIHEIFGHHFEEPIRFLNYGESGTFKFGQNIKNRDIVISDNPLQQIEGFKIGGFTNIDAYGRKREKSIHIQNGEVKEFLGGEYADPNQLKQFLNLDKSHFIGRSSQHIDGCFPQPRMSCTIIDGPTEKNDLEGRILLVPNGGHTQPQDKTYMVKANEAYVIKDGEPRRLIPLQVTGGINQALANITLLESQSYQVGLCSKANPINMSQPSQNPVSQYTRDQIWKMQQVYPLPISDTHLKILFK